MLVCPPHHIDSAKKALDRLGFHEPHVNNLFSSASLVKVASFAHESKNYLIHLYIVRDDSPWVNHFRNFRDRLRLDPAFRSAYQDLKRSFFAKGFVSIAEYARVKSEFIQRVLS